MLQKTQAIVGHRGAAGLAIENTLAAVKAAARSGAVGIEFDAQLLGDGTVVVHHDAKLGRVMAGEQALMALTMADLEFITPVGRCGSDSDERVPTLLDVLRCADQHGLAMNIEIKNDGCSPDRIAEAVLAVLSSWPGSWSGQISSFDREVLAVFAREVPQWSLGWIVSEVPDDWMQTLSGLKAHSLNVCFKALTRGTVQRIHQAGYQVQSWTVNEPVTARRLLDWGVDAIITDYPDRMARLL